MPSKKRPKQVESWQKWLLSIFLLCLFQGWLLSLASVLLGLVFAILTLPAIVIISISQAWDCPATNFFQANFDQLERSDRLDNRWFDF
jgi:5-bromo-4-chloroindolyl phosphate hydrolysis protein